MHRLGDRVETIERKSSWEGQQSNTIRSPNFRKNQNPNVGRAGPDQDIRPPFQENYVEASTSSEPTTDPHINLMDLNGEQQIFLTQEDQDDHDINQFQTKSGESFDFIEGYDATLYEVHKQYKLRSRTIDIPEPIKPPKKIKDKAVLTEPSDKMDPNPKEVTIEDVSDVLASKNQRFTLHSSKENSKSNPQNTSKTEIPQDNIQDQEKITENAVEKEKLLVTTQRLNWRKPSI